MLLDESNTDYGNATTGGVIKGTGDYSFSVDNQGRPIANVLSYSNYLAYSTNNFISKGTLENVITGKGLVSNTDYATNSTGGVVKIDAYAITKNTNGNLMANIYNYSTYSTASDNSFISKGTLENVLNEKIGNINTILATLTTPSNQGGNS